MFSKQQVIKMAVTHTEYVCDHTVASWNIMETQLELLNYSNLVHLYRGSNSSEHCMFATGL